MKKGLMGLLCVLAFTAHGGAGKTMTCVLQGLTDPVVFAVPKTMGEKPVIDFSYPIRVTVFSLRDNNVLLMAVDNEDNTRPRLFISAQTGKNQPAYTGQYMTDSGGNALQLDNGPVTCRIK